MRALPVSGVARGRWRVPRYGRWRRAVQVATATAFVVLPFLASTTVTGTYVALRLGRVDLVEPSTALAAVVAAGEIGVALALAAGPLLLMGAVLGPVYCAWGCPFGLVSELVDEIRRRLRPAPWRDGTSAALRSRRLLLLVALLLVSAAAGFPVAALLAPPRLVTALPLEWRALGAVPLVTSVLLGAFLAIEVLAPRRLTCRLLCPAGAFGALLRRRGTLAPRFDRARCFCPGVAPCLQECPWAIDPRSMAPLDGCTTCLACVDRCPSAALSVGFGSAQRREEALPDARGDAEELRH